MKQLIIVIILIVILATNLWASVTGTVNNATTQLAVAGAKVKFGTVDSTTTDSLGQFSLPNIAAGRYVVRIQKYGYQVWRDTVTLVTGTNAYNAQLTVLTVDPAPVGLWTFDNTANHVAATTGNDLILSGTDSLISGPTTGDGAINIGVGSYFRCNHDIPANGGGTEVNVYTVVIDFRVPSIGQWYCFWQTNPTNTNDGDCFVNPNGTIGVAATTYSQYAIQANEWYRLVVSISMGTHYTYYLDGQLLNEATNQTTDGRFSLYPSSANNQILFFADEDGEDNMISVAKVALYDRDLTAAQVGALGGFGHNLSSQPNAMKPYLQSPTTNSIWVSWHAAPSLLSTVQYGTSASTLTQSATGTAQTLGTNVIWHSVQLTNLQSNTEYFYRCVTDTMQSLVYSFRTPPANNDHSRPLRFVMFGDSQSDVTRSTATAMAIRQKTLELYGDSLHNTVNCLLHAGDIGGNGAALAGYVTEYFNPFQTISREIPMMISVGNHEGESNFFYNYMKYEAFGGSEGERYYSFRIGDTRIIMLNGNVAGTTQLTWLTSELQAAQADTSIDWIITVSHQPGHSEIWPDGNWSWMQTSVLPMLDTCSKATLVVDGHSHCYEHGVRTNGNEHFMIVGGGGGALDRWRMYPNQTDYPDVFRSLDEYCYLIVEIDPSAQTFTCTTYGLGNTDRPRNNQVIDRWSRSLRAIAPYQPANLTSGAVYPNDTLWVSTCPPNDSLLSTQVQITSTLGNYTSPLLDTLRNFENFYLDSGTPNYTPIDRNAGIMLKAFPLPASRLRDSTTYGWRFRYRTKNLNWSSWSQEAAFTYRRTDVAETATTPFTYSLLPNYPNPFNPKTTLRFSLAAPGRARITVFDATGRLVATVTDQHYPAGQYEIPFDGTRLPSGTYFCRFETNRASITHSIVLMK